MKRLNVALAVGAAMAAALLLWSGAEAAVLGCAANGLVPEPEEEYAAVAENEALAEENWKVIIGDPLIIAVGSKGGIALWACQPDGIKSQYYGVSDWGSVVWFGSGEGAESYGSPYFSWEYTWVRDAGATVFGEGSPQVESFQDGVTTVKTELLLGDRAVLTRKIIYAEGDYGFRTRLELKNVSGEEIEDVRVINGGDTYFGFDDWSRSWYDEGRKLVYINNDEFLNSGIMIYQGAEVTPADHYAGVFYADGWEMAALAGVLTDSATPDYVDMSTYLEWDRGSLAPGATMIVEAVQQVSDPTPIAVIAPADAVTVNNVELSLDFSVQNLDEGNGVASLVPANEVPHTLLLEAVSARGWRVEIVGEETVELATFERRAVRIRVSVPPSASPGDTDTITLTARDETVETIFGAASVSVSVAANDYQFSSVEADFGRTKTGKTKTRTITLTNGNGGEEVLLGQVGGSDHLEGPFSISSDSCSGSTVGAGGSCTVVVAFAPEADGDFLDSFNVPVLSPNSQNWTVSVRGTGDSSFRLYDEKINYGCLVETLGR